MKSFFLLIAPFTNVAILFGLAAFVYARNRKSQANIRFSIFLISVVLWNLANFLWIVSKNPYMQILWYRLMHCAATFISVTFLHFVFSFLKIKKDNLLRFGYLLSGIVSFSTFTPYFLKNIIIIDQYSWKGAPGPFFYVFLFNLFGLSLISVFFLLKKYAESSFKKRNQLKYMIIPVLLSYIGGAIDFFPHIGISIMPYSKFIVTLCTAMLAYAILAHKLFDINIIIKKTVVYSVLVAAMTVLYFVAIFAVENIFKVYLGYKSFAASLMIVILFIIIFQPFKNYIQSILDRYFFRGTIEQIEEENIKLRDEIQRSEKMKTVSILAAGMAHEIKNPLTSIKTFTEYLPERHGDIEFIAKFHKIVGNAVDSINNTVRQLLIFSKPNEPVLKSVCINKLIDDTLIFLNNDFEKRNIKIEKQYINLPALNLDSSQIKQVFLNIFLNALDAMREGGNIFIKTLLNENGNILVKIRDTGCGIEKKDLKHIFDPFFTKKEKGTGLGLSVAHNIIKKHKGNISVNSQIGKGTEFEIVFNGETNHMLKQEATCIK